MEITQFTINEASKYNMFYMLQRLDSDIEDFMLYSQDVGSTSAFYDFNIFKMENKQLLLAFDDPFKYSNKYNLVATDGNIFEIVNLQPFERIWEYYDKSTESAEGFFVFMNSVPMALDGLDWRCDNAKYGPLGYNVGLDMDEPMLKTLDQIVVYEPVLSINSVGHLIYANVVIPEEIEDYFINGNPIPFYGRTLSEVFKQLSEWSAVTNSPFENTEEMALDAKEFLDQISFDNYLISNQVDMQIFEYLKGNQNARVRPNGIQPNSNELKDFIKKNCSHGSLSILLTLYPSAFSGDIKDVVQIEKNRIQRDFEDFFAKFLPNNIDTNIENIDEVLQYILDNSTIEGLKLFSRIKVNFIKIQQQLLNLID